MATNADFEARLNEILDIHKQISSEASNYEGNFNPDDEETLNRISTIQSIASDLKEDIQHFIEFFHTRADQVNFDHGNVNTDSTVEAGDPRRPGLDG